MNQYRHSFYKLLNIYCILLQYLLVSRPVAEGKRQVVLGLVVVVVEQPRSLGAPVVGAGRRYCSPPRYVDRLGLLVEQQSSAPVVGPSR